MTLQLSAVTTPTFSTAVQATAIIYEPVSGHLVLVTGDNGLWYATDPDGPWTQGTGPGPNWSGAPSQVVTMGGITVVLCVPDTTISSNRGVSVSSDGGATWTVVALNTDLQALVADPSSAKFLLYQNANPSNSLVRDSVDGLTWSAGVNMTVPAGFGIVMWPAAGGPNGVVTTRTTGSADAVLYSTDGGVTFLEGSVTGDFDGSAFSLVGSELLWCGDRWVVPFYDGIGFGFLTSTNQSAWATVRPAAMSSVSSNSGVLAWNDTDGWLCYNDYYDGTFLSSDFTTFYPVTLGLDGTDVAWQGRVLVQTIDASPADTFPIRYATATNDTVISGLDHLEGMEVSVVNNGVVIASPNNAEFAPVIVTGGTITLTGPLTGTVTVGLPYTTDIQTLDIDAVSTTVKERGLNIGGVIAWIEETGSFYAGPIVPTGDTLTGLERYTPQNDQGYDVSGPVTGVAEVTLQSTYNNSGRVLIRQVDPVPLTILSIAPTGFLNGGR
jgi:hypothetical protein